MEFLDDLLNPPKSGSESDAQAGNTPSEGTGEAVRQPVQQTYPTPVEDQEAWTDLLEGVAFDDPGAEIEPAKAKRGRSRRARGQGLATSQKIVLGILGLVVVGIWVVVGLLVSRSFAARGIDGDQVAVVSYPTETPVAPQPDQTEPDTSTENEAGNETTPPEPLASPTATPPVFTGFDRQIQDDPTNIDLYLQRAETYITLGAYQAALADLETAKGLDKFRAEIYINEGWANFYRGHWQRAEEAFGTAIAFNQDLPEPHFGLGQVFFYVGQYEEAASEFDWAAEINPENAEAEAWLGISAAKSGDKEEAYGAVGRAISQTDTLPIVYIAQSWARRTESPPDIDGAQSDLLYAQDLERNDFLTLNALAEFYVTHRPERLSEAELLASYAHNWATNDVERAVALQTLGRVYLQQNRKVDAERAFVEAADLTSRDGEIVLMGLTEDLEKAKE